MAKRVSSGLKRYWYLVPVVFLFALGVLWRSAVVPTSTMAEDLACSGSDITGFVDLNAKTALWQGRTIGLPEEALAQGDTGTKVLGVANPSERWIEVDLSEQKLRAWDGDTKFVETSVSTGLPGTPTPKGEFRIWLKVRATKMEGGAGRYYYNLPNVPYVMFFGNNEVNPGRGYGLHGTYWHSDFGTRRSHGCVNLPTPIAKMLYEWTTPGPVEGSGYARSSESNPGTRIVIHD